MTKYYMVHCMCILVEIKKTDAEMPLISRPFSGTHNKWFLSSGIPVETNTGRCHFITENLS